MSDYTEHSEYRALLAAVCASPDDDLPRLVLADWLDEHGESERAAFILVQVEIEKGPPPPAPDESLGEAFAVMGKWSMREWELRRRERKLWEVVRRAFGLQADVYPVLKGWDSRAHDSLAFVTRGWVSEWHGSLAVWCGGECEGCGPAVRGGMGHRSPDCPACHGTGLTVGIGPQLVRSHPVERVWLVDRHADVSGPPNGPNRHWRWVNADRGDGLGGYQQFTLPGWLFALVTEKFGNRFPTREAANAAISAAAIAWAKSHQPSEVPA